MRELLDAPVIEATFSAFIEGNPQTGAGTAEAGVLRIRIHASARLEDTSVLVQRKRWQEQQPGVVVRTVEADLPGWPGSNACDCRAGH